MPYPLTQPGNPFGHAHVRVYNADAQPLGILPDVINLTMSFELNGPGAISFDYPANGIHAALLHETDVILAPIIGGNESGNWFLMEDDADDPSDAAGRGRLVRCTGRGTLAVLERAVVYPKTHTPGGGVNGLTPEHKFDNATPGAILHSLIQRAKARGAIPELVTSTWSTTHDSAGQPWPLLYDVTYNSGTDYLTVLQAMCDQGWVDVDMRGFGLRLYVPDTAMATDMPGIVLRRGQNVLDSPEGRKKTRRGMVTVALGQGADKKATEATDTAALAEYGRREGYAGDGRIESTTTLSRLAQQVLAEKARPSEGFELTVALDEPPGEQWPLPGRDFDVGDLVRYEVRRLTPTSLEPIRVRGITYRWESDQLAKVATVTLADRFLERAIRNGRRLEGVLNGSVTAAPPPPSPKTIRKTVSPAAPAGVSVSSAVYHEAGRPRVAATVTWTPPSENADATPLEDLAYHLVSYALTATPSATDWKTAEVANTASATIRDLPPGAPFVVRVSAVDSAPNQGAWAESPAVTLDVDVTPPPVPSTPDATARLGQVTVAWDGTNQSGAPAAPDFDHVEIHISELSGFVPDASTLIDRLPGPGLRVISDLPYGETRYIRLVAVDRSGNASDPSTQTAVVVTPLVNTDVIGEIIAGANIVDGSLVASEKVVAESITGGLIQALAISAGHIAANAVTAEKVQAGAVSADKIALGAVGEKQSALGPNNLIPDGSWEDAQWRGLRAPSLPAALSFVAGVGEDGGHVLRCNAAVDAGATRVMFPIAGGLTVVGGQKFHVRARVKASVGATGTVLLGVRWTDRSGVTTLTPSFADAAVTADGAWHTLEGIVHVPASTVLMEPRIGIGPTGTAGTVDIDHVDLRAVLASTADTGRSVEISPMGVRLFGSPSLAGARVELTADGLRAYDSSGGQTVDIASATGNAVLTGKLQTGLTGRRIIVDPTGNGTIYFYPSTGADYAWINSPETPDDNSTTLGMNTGTFSYGGAQSRHRIWMLNAGFVLESRRTSTGDRIGYGATWDATTLRLDRYTSAGAQTGAHLLLDADQFRLNRLGSGQINGGSIYGDATQLILETQNLGVVAGKVFFDDDGRWVWTNAVFDNAIDRGGAQGVFSGKFTMLSGTSWTFTYGSTRASAMAVVLTPRLMSGGVGSPSTWSVVTNNAAGFAWATVSTREGDASFWNARLG